MKFKYFSKNEKQRKLIIASILGLGIIIGGISLYRSYALYEEEKEYNVLKGQIPDFGYDVKVAITVDGKKQESVPGRKDNNKDKYYEVQVTCNNNTQGEWDYNAWNLKIDSITSDSKCNIAFASNLSKDQYQNYIDAGIAYRRNTYRGKDLTEFFTNNKEEFYKQIKDGTFDDIYVGDYIIDNEHEDINSNPVKYLVADIDNYLHIGTPELTSHHLTIIPSSPLMNAQMNDTDTSIGGYKGSKMNTEILESVYSTYIKPVFTDSHVLKYSSLLTNLVDEKAANRYETETNHGASSSWELVTGRKLDLMSEMNVYGGIVFSSSGLDTGMDKQQYAIFQLKPEFINCYKETRFDYWLKDVANSNSFAIVDAAGNSYYNWATNLRGVRPKFLIG